MNWKCCFHQFLAESGPLSPVVQPLWHTLVAALVTLHSDPLICCNCHGFNRLKAEATKGFGPNGCGQVAYGGKTTLCYVQLDIFVGMNLELQQAAGLTMKSRCFEMKWFQTARILQKFSSPGLLDQQ